ncbi:PIN domain-containing protein [Nocardia sp. XZ_19_385]|uniref:PIN domain-containing protein n=1 Tax=Nocardia sp. XZ_19_385 TaxID=2769488 RepID=UPI0018906292|nr:PIN domain-containing protein [Nocardia sp. XZ_19_385]
MTLVLDSEGLSRAVRRDRAVGVWLAAARDEDRPVITSAAVLVEVAHPAMNRSAFAWTLSRIEVEPVTRAVAMTASDLLAGAGLHGHKYAIDSMLCATALDRPGLVTILTSDTDDIDRLIAKAGRRVQVMRL